MRSNHLTAKRDVERIFKALRCREAFSVQGVHGAVAVMLDSRRLTLATYDVLIGIRCLRLHLDFLYVPPKHFHMRRGHLSKSFRLLTARCMSHSLRAHRFPQERAFTTMTSWKDVYTTGIPLCCEVLYESSTFSAPTLPCLVISNLADVDCECHKHHGRYEDENAL